MGKVLAAARVENVGALLAVDQGSLSRRARCERLRCPTPSWTPGRLGCRCHAPCLGTLGLKYLRTRKALSSAGPMGARVFGTARLTVQGRDCPVDITELPDGCPMLIGQIPLEAMDFVVDMAAIRLVGNPDHGGEHVIELY